MKAFADDASDYTRFWKQIIEIWHSVSFVQFTDRMLQCKLCIVVFDGGETKSSE